MYELKLVPFQAQQNAPSCMVQDGACGLRRAYWTVRVKVVVAVIVVLVGL